MNDEYFHTFKSLIKDIDLPKNFTYPFNYEPHPLSVLAANQLQDLILNSPPWQHDFGLIESSTQIGKMFGVLVVKNKIGEIGFLAAFSGRIGDSMIYPKFVPPIFDLLKTDGFFKQGEEEINNINKTVIALIESREYKEKHSAHENAILQAENEIKSFEKQNKEAKKLRQKERENGIANLSKEEYENLDKKLKNESIKNHYDFKQLKKQWKVTVEEKKQELNSFLQKVNELKTERKEKSALLQQKLFEQYQFLNINKETKSVLEIFANTPQGIPPSGAGECAAPKLLQFAFKNKLTPICMAEFWWGKTPSSEIRKHKQFYPSCRGKCKPILEHMLSGMNVDERPLAKNLKQGFTILHEDEHIIVINKKHDFLSVPGNTELESVESQIRKLHPNIDSPVIVHRLDMSTSGLMVLAKTKDAHKNLQEQFTNRSTKKRYTAILDGFIKEDSGIIELPLRVDLDDRPRQLVCFEHGKYAKTKWEVIERKDNTTRVHFYLFTGRTHQLRVHSSHIKGLNTPIVGDDLYGKRKDRLCLHADLLEFNHPNSNERLIFENEAPF